MRTLINNFVIILSLFTAPGVFMHDAQIEKVTASSHVADGKVTHDSGMTASEPHAHPERTNSTLKGFAYQSPSIQPREQKLKKYLMQNIEPRGRHAFDNYYLPIVA